MLKISKEENLVQQHQVARQLVRGVAHEIKNPWQAFVEQHNYLLVA
jgi:nitrogen-specific signal transduction histidine kinase